MPAVTTFSHLPPIAPDSRLWHPIAASACQRLGITVIPTHSNPNTRPHVWPQGPVCQIIDSDRMSSQKVNSWHLEIWRSALDLGSHENLRSLSGLNRHAPITPLTRLSESTLQEESRRELSNHRDLLSHVVCADLLTRECNVWLILVSVVGLYVTSKAATFCNTSEVPEWYWPFQPSETTRLSRQLIRGSTVPSCQWEVRLLWLSRHEQNRAFMRMCTPSSCLS